MPGMTNQGVQGAEWGERLVLGGEQTHALGSRANQPQPTASASASAAVDLRGAVRTGQASGQALAAQTFCMFLSEASYWSRPPRHGSWTSQRRLAINVISDGEFGNC